MPYGWDLSCFGMDFFMFLQHYTSTLTRLDRGNRDCDSMFPPLSEIPILSHPPPPQAH